MRARSNATNLPTSPKNIAHATKKWHAFRSLETHFVCKNTTFPAPATYPNFIKHCTCHEKWPCKITKYCNRHEEWHASINICCACYEKKWHASITKCCACRKKSDVSDGTDVSDVLEDASDEWATLLWAILLWATELLSSSEHWATLLNCYMTEVFLDWTAPWDWTTTCLNCFLTKAFLDSTVPWLNCSLTELCLDWTVTWRNCSLTLTELFLDGTVPWRKVK